MPPLSFHEYEHVNQGPQIEAQQVESNAGHKLKTFITHRREVAGYWKTALKTSGSRGWPTEKAGYPTPNETGQRTLAWVVDHGYSQLPLELYLQTETKTGGAWKTDGEPALVAEIDTIWGTFKYLLDDVSTMKPEARLRLAYDFSETVDAIIGTNATD